MDIFIAIAQNWGEVDTIGVFATEADALAAIEEVKTWQWQDEGEPVYGHWSFYVHRTELGSLMVTHPDEEVDEE